MECLIHAHSFHGDVEGTLKALARYKEMGYTPTRFVHNNVLSAYLNSPGFNCWQDIINYFETSHGDFQSEADLATYQIFLAACHKYQRRSEAIFWFNEALTRGRLDVSRLKKPLLHVIGNREYGHYRSQLCPEDRSTFDVERAPEKYTRPTPRRRREAKAAALAAAALAEEEMAAVTLSNSSSSIPYSAPTPGSVAVTESTSTPRSTIASSTSTSNSIATSTSSKESHRLVDTEPLSLSMPMAWHTIN